MIKFSHYFFYVPTGSSNAAQGTWGDFGKTTTSNPYWQGSVITAGRRFNSTQSWYPASGLRYYNSGALDGVASNGYSWSASPCADAANARYLDFRSAGVYPTGYNGRSCGFPVRCVQE